MDPLAAPMPEAGPGEALVKVLYMLMSEDVV